MRRSENFTRLILFLAVALIHVLVIFFVVFEYNAAVKEEEQRAEIMKLVDLREEAPPPPPPRPRPPEPVTNTVEAIAETMIETDEPPPDEVYTDMPVTPYSPPTEEIEYLPMHKISTLPQFSERELLSALVYPPIALRSNIEGMVYLELFVDAQGEIRRITVLRENPEGRGFGEAAVNAFRGIRGSPAMANGKAVAVRYRYPVRFTLK
ncbi:hypothetical protein AGMMS49928_09130 [Spirochaetia bacterium]|nr:hypothetical protein AGMMS49928_09130 [Spirochaetia bacterium]